MSRVSHAAEMLRVCARRLPREDWRVAEEATRAADTLAAYFAEPTAEELARLTAAVEADPGVCAEHDVRTVLKAIGSEP